MNLTSQLYFLSQTRAHDVALSTHSSQIDYQTLERRVNYWVSWCKQRNFTPQRRVGLMIRDEVLLASLILALARLGITFMTIPRSATSSQQYLWTQAAQIDFLVKDDQALNIPEVSSFYLAPNSGPTGDDLSDSFSSPIAINEDPQALMIVVGSGSTGRPKLIPISHAQMQNRIEVIHEVYEYKMDDRTATMAHLEYTAGITRLFASLGNGTVFVILDRDNFDLHRLLSDYALTRLSATVFHVENMLIDAKGSQEPLLKNLHLSVSGSPVSDHLRHRIIRHLTPNLWIAYGTNEVWTTSVAKPQDVLAHPRTLGRIAPGAEVQIVDEHFKPLPANQVGMICIRARGSIEQYLHPEANDALIFRDGWFIPKDLGLMTTDGHLIFYGRNDNLMIYNGINIYPAEIENCLANHPCVLDVIAIPLSHPIHHQIPVAIVSLSEVTSAHALLQYCEAHLGFRAPQQIFIVPSLERNKQGKLTQATLEKILSNLNDA